MTIFNSRKENVVHYLTMVTHKRVPVFRSEKACQIFIDVLGELREKLKVKLIGYVVMPDHVHLLVNPIDCDISNFGKALKSLTARKIIDWLKRSGFSSSLEKLKLAVTQKRNHAYAVWQKKVRSIDLESPKFVLQKLNYVHMNPVRAGFCDHPAKWKWSSFHSYLPHEPGDVPIEIDWKVYWTVEEFEVWRSETASKRSNVGYNADGR